jgi:uracil-DNA glycosylase
LSERELLALEVATIDPSWLELLQDEIRKPYFIKLKEALWKEGVRGVHGKCNKTNVFPPAHDIYSWSRHTPVHRVRVVGIGQDPYHGKGKEPSLAGDRGESETLRPLG